MIRKLRIKNFKGLSDLTIENLSRVNLIGGSNNAGKTSLLEALFLFHDKHNPHMFLRLHGWRGFQSVELTPESMWAPIFLTYNMKADIEISVDTDKKEHKQLIFRLNNNYVTHGIEGQPFPPFNGRPPQIKTNVKPTKSVALDIIYNESKNNKKPQTAHLFMEPNSGSIGMQIDFQDSKNIPATFLAATIRNNAHEDAVRFGKMDLIGEQNEIVKFIQDTIEPRLLNLSAIALTDQSAVLHANIEGINRKIPVSYMGDGMARLVSMILTISNTKNGCIFIDEIENGIHYSVLPKIWTGIVNAAIKYNCQIFATTHSYECLEAAVNSLPKELQDEFRYIRLERDNDNILSNIYSFAELRVSINRKWEIR